MCSEYRLEQEEFLAAARRLAAAARALGDSWRLRARPQPHLDKRAYVRVGDETLKLHYVVSYSAAYAAPLLAFNAWRASGELLPLADLPRLSLLPLNTKEDPYSAITQQEHPLFFRPYFVVHPCRTGEVLSGLKDKSHNILISFLSAMGPLVGLSMDLKYAIINSES